MMHAMPERSCDNDLDFEIARDICLDVMALFLAQKRALSKLASVATGQEKERLIKLQEKTEGSVSDLFNDAQLLKYGNGRVCKKAFSEYLILRDELEEENSRGQFHHDRQTPTVQPL